MSLPAQILASSTYPPKRPHDAADKGGDDSKKRKSQKFQKYPKFPRKSCMYPKWSSNGKFHSYSTIEALSEEVTFVPVLICSLPLSPPSISFSLSLPVSLSVTLPSPSHRREARGLSYGHERPDASQPAQAWSAVPSDGSERSSALPGVHHVCRRGRRYIRGLRAVQTHRQTPPSCQGKGLYA